jgi:hypothetical protein
MFLEDVNAISALLSGLGLTVLVLFAYYLRMLGRYRVRVAVGGTSLGIGLFCALLVGLIKAGLVPLALSPFSQFALVLVSIVFVAAGLLNATAHSGKIF